MKAVLAVDMPESCSKCKFMYEFYGVKKCQPLNILENSGKAIIPAKELTAKRKDCCPLKTDYEQEIRNKAIDEFVAEAMKQFTEYDLKHGYPTVTDCEIILRDIAEQMKGGK